MASSIHWVWSIGIFLIVMCSSETEGQKQVPLQESFQYTVIPNTRRTFCSNPLLKSMNYNCFKGEDNICGLTNDTMDFYVKRPEKQELHMQRITKMCTDVQFNKNFTEFVKCMEQHSSEWSDCRKNELKLTQEMIESMKNNKPIKDMVCDSQWEVVLTCYETVGNKICFETSKPVFETIEIHDNDGLCTSSAANFSSALFIALIAVFISIGSSFHFN